MATLNKKHSKPNVLVAGFPRSGSTYIYHILKQHPDIFIPEIKEINYFNKDHFFIDAPEIINPRYFKPRKWYYSFFKTNKKVVIDFSILYALDIASARRVKKELGAIKIIFITRNKEDFEKSVLSTIKSWGSRIPSNFKDFSDFDLYINNYKNYFDKIYVLPMEKFNKNPKKELENLLNFLNVKKYNFNLNVSKHETKRNPEIGKYQYLRHRAFINLIRVIYKLISFSVSGKAKSYEYQK